MPDSPSLKIPGWNFQIERVAACVSPCRPAVPLLPLLPSGPDGVRSTLLPGGRRRLPWNYLRNDGGWSEELQAFSKQREKSEIVERAGLLAPSLGRAPTGPPLRGVKNRSRRFFRTQPIYTSRVRIPGRLAHSQMKRGLEGPFSFGYWRRGRDSNPRYPFEYTHFPGVLLQPLGHLSC